MEVSWIGFNCCSVNIHLLTLVWNLLQPTANFTYLIHLAIRGKWRLNLHLQKESLVCMPTLRNWIIIATYLVEKSWLGEGIVSLVSGVYINEVDTVWFISASGSNLDQDQEWRYSNNLISMSFHTDWAGSCGSNVINRVTRPSSCGLPVVELKSNLEEVVFPLCFGQLGSHTHKHMVKSLGRQANWFQTGRQKSSTRCWNQHNRVMLICSHIKKNRRKETTCSIFLLTSRQWEELSGNGSLMKSSRVLGTLVWLGVGEVGVTVEGTPSVCCLISSFWWRRSFLKSLAFRHGGLSGSTPIPAPKR